MDRKCTFVKAYKTRLFNKWAKKNKVSDSDLYSALEEIEKGLVDADLGRKLVKKRVKRQGSGKSGGYRTILAYITGKKAFFLYAFGKNQKSNITESEKSALEILGNSLLKMSETDIVKRLKDGSLIEVLEDKNG